MNRDPYQLTQLVVEVIGEQGGIVQVRDSLSNEIEIDGTLRPKGTGEPQSGEQWVIVKRMGLWTFDAMLGAPRSPTVVGEREGLHPIISQILDMLAAQGLVIDGTNPPLDAGFDLLDPTTDPPADPELDPEFDPDAEDADWMPFEEEEFVPGPEDDPEEETKKEENEANPKDPEQVWSYFSVVTYNQKFWMGLRRAKADINKLRKTRADVIGLQEAHPSERDAFFDGLRDQGWGVIRDGSSHSAAETILFRKSSMNFLASGVHQISTSDGPGTYRPSRWVTWVRLRHVDSDQVITVMDTHLDSGGAPYGRWRKGRKAERLRGQIRQLPGLVRQHSKRGPVILLGDFNMDWFKDDRIRLPGLLGATLRRVNMHATYKYLGRPTPKGVGTIGKYGTIFDHQYLRKKRGVPVEPRFHKILRGYYSDHRPYMVTYRIKNRLGKKATGGR